VAPVLDPATRTAQVEVDIPNLGFRLKPGMYARVSFTVDHRKDTLTVPANAVVDLGEQRGVFLPGDGETAKFQAVSTGLADQRSVEITSGLSEGDRIISTGAAALRDGDRIVLAGEGDREGGQRAGGGAGRSGGPRGGGDGQDTGDSVRQGNGTATSGAPGTFSGGEGRRQGGDAAADRQQGGSGRESAPALDRGNRP
jgi:hypothetical protein